jgi:DNA-binding LacI/PurR family transcriptional regulator
MGVHQPLSSRERVARYRADMRAKGMRLKQIWVPDVTSEAFKAEAHRQSLLVAHGEHEAEYMAFIESQVDFNDWPEWRDE